MCGIAGAVDLTGVREFSPQRLLAMTGAIGTVVRTTNSFTSSRVWHLGQGGLRSSTWRVGDSRSVTRMGRSGSHSTVSFSSTRSCAGSWWPPVTFWQHDAIRRRGFTFTRSMGRRCSRTPGDSSRCPSGIGISRTLVLGRDRVGICPLYYAEADGWLLWGSEIQALLASGLVASRADVRGIDHFFTFFGPGTSRTLFEGVKSLPPGHFLKIRDGRVTKHRYWELDFPDAGMEQRLENPAPLIDEFEATLRRAVERRLRSDVPVVSYISGGLDSTVVLGPCSQQRGDAIPAFTVGLDRAGPDERAAGVGSRRDARLAASPQWWIKPRSLPLIPSSCAAECPVLDTSALPFCDWRSRCTSGVTRSS